MGRLGDLSVALYRALRLPFAGRGLMRFRLLRFLRDVLQRRVGRASIRVRGHRMYLDTRDSLGFLGGDPYEPMATSVVEQNVRPGATVVDVGAHIGYFTVLMAQLVGPTGHVIAVEPDPELFALLQRNVAANGYRNVVARQEAVADASGTLSFEVGGASWGHYLRVGAAAPAERTIEVKAVRLDDITPGPVDFLKIDVEGVEMLALRGMRDLLLRSPSLRMLTEFWPVGLLRAGTDPRSYLEELVSLGFTLYDVDETARAVKPATISALVLRYPPVGSLHTNILCALDAPRAPAMSEARCPR